MPDTLRLHAPAVKCETPQGFTVSDLCNRWRIGADKIHTFIRQGELVAVNLAANRSGRPQWRVTPESLHAFEARRSSMPPSKPQKRRRQAGMVDYYP